MPDMRIYSPSVAKVLVSIDDRLLGRIDRAARDAGMTRSGYISRLAERELEVRPDLATLERRRQALEAIRELVEKTPIPDDVEDSTTEIRRMRDAR